MHMKMPALIRKITQEIGLCEFVYWEQSLCRNTVYDIVLPLAVPCILEVGQIVVCIVTGIFPSHGTVLWYFLRGNFTLKMGLCTMDYNYGHCFTFITLKLHCTKNNRTIKSTLCQSRTCRSTAVSQTYHLQNGKIRILSVSRAKKNKKNFTMTKSVGNRYSCRVTALNIIY